MAQPRDVRRLGVPGVAVPDRDQRLPRPDPAQQSPPASRSLDSLGEVPWLQPYPDQLLDEVAPREDEPDAVAVQRETIELAFLAAIQLLPPRQRAVLILRDVIEWSAKETADLLGMSVPAANSALQRARATMAAHRPHGRVGRPPPDVTPEERALLERSIAAHEAADVTALAEMLREDVRIAMPPLPFWFNDKATFLPGLGPGLREPGEWRLVEIRANRMPAVATLSAAVGRDGVPALQDRRHAHGGRSRRRDHHVRCAAVPRVRAPADTAGALTRR